ncbi:uncharacterized protein YALI1_D28963g [Yarrowia lipolytica]|uniref:Uncharacterized protein n=1 Tax=Yarrowia lipolytica TaxID=4952 RepID=A0A1D8NFQ4_YARLL|nr:hypothetical protein YALI1_D28963g [Yarrowia lipolytica]
MSIDYTTSLPALVVAYADRISTSCYISKDTSIVGEDGLGNTIGGDPVVESQPKINGRRGSCRVKSCKPREHINKYTNVPFGLEEDERSSPINFNSLVRFEDLGRGRRWWWLDRVVLF